MYNSGNWFRSARHEHAELHHACVSPQLCGAVQLVYTVRCESNYRDLNENTWTRDLAKPRVQAPTRTPGRVTPPLPRRVHGALSTVRARVPGDAAAAMMIAVCGCGHHE